MKIIKISTELEMTIHDFPEGTMREQNKALYELIGNGCDIVEHVMPKRLYTMLKMSPTPTRTPAKYMSYVPEVEKSLEEKFEELKASNEMLTGCVLEMSELVYQ